MAVIDPSLDIVQRLSLTADRSDAVRASLAKTLLPEAAGVISALRQQLAQLTSPTTIDRDELAEHCDDEVLLADGLEEGFVGLSANTHHPQVAVYDLEKCIAVLMRHDEMSYEEAEEYLEFNTLCAYVGERTPIFYRAVGICPAGDCSAESGGNPTEGNPDQDGVAG